MATESQEPGWESIDAAFAEVYPASNRTTSRPRCRLRSAARSTASAPTPRTDRWHFVTYGLTELYEKESDDPDVSGWGYELTLLAPRTDEPPAWAFELLLAVATQTNAGGTRFDVGHRLDTGHDITGGDGPLTAVAFCEDRLVTPSALPFGRYKLLQLVGITTAELAGMKGSSTQEGLDRLRDHDPLLRTDPARR